MTHIGFFFRLSLYAIFLICAYAQTNVVINSEKVGRIFDGIGAISGGGATSKLLRTYNETIRNEILDYLFKPGIGSSLHMLKVEMGGDVQSTEGTEASHMHAPDDENYNRGYEWWLMKEAKKRNPNIKLLGLPWGFPGWLGSSTRTPYANNTATATYVTKWIIGAKAHHNLTIDYMGIWNEKPYDIEYVKTLRSMLNANGFKHVKLVVGDGTWAPADDAAKNPSFNDAFEVIGAHYPGTISSTAAKANGKQLWSSEDYSTISNDVGSGCLARILNQNYVNGHMSATISWNLITSYYDNLPFPRASLMTANQPWSGHYEVPGPLWVTAHTTHFTKSGWKYLSHGSGVGVLKGGGSYVSLMSPDGADLTIIIETMSHDQSTCVRPYLWPYMVAEEQSIMIDISNFAKNITSLRFYVSNITSNGDASYFKKQPDIVLSGKQMSMSVKKNSLITLTSLPASNPPNISQSPQKLPFPLPYLDDFENNDETTEPRYITSQAGYFEVTTNPIKLNTKCVSQVVTEAPVHWCPILLSAPMAVVGPGNWSAINTSLSVMLPDAEASSGVALAIRVDQGGCQTFMAKGVFVWLLKLEGRLLISGDLVRSMPLYSIPMKLKSNVFYRIQIVDQTTSIDIFLDGKKVATIKPIETAPTKGFVALATDNFGRAYFDDLVIRAVPENKRLRFGAV